MINGTRVVAWTPYGRQNTMRILIEYIRRDIERGLLDEYYLYVNLNNDQQQDREYLEELVTRYSWIKLFDVPADVKNRPNRSYRIAGFYQHAAKEPDTLFLRFDDDIVYVHQDAVTQLVAHRLSSTGLCSFPMIWNNAVVTWYLQQAGIIPMEWGAVEKYCMDPLAWTDPDFVIKMHGFLLDRLETGDPAAVNDLFPGQNLPLPLGEQFSINCFAAFGSCYSELDEPGVVPFDEEGWHTKIRPSELGVQNTVVAAALVTHYSFFPTRDVLGGTDILDRYARVAGAI